MRISLRTACGFLLAALLCFVGVTAHAQFRASIQGTVTDTTGAAIPGATVTLKDTATNATQTATSNGDGVYNFGQLGPDKYTLTASATGFKQKVLQDVTIIPEQANSINIQLEIGETSTSVTVSADTVSALDTETPNVGATITSNDIQHMPSFGRDVTNLMQLVPGTIDDGSQAASGGTYKTPAGGQSSPGPTPNGGSMPTENQPQAFANGQQVANNSVSIDGISTVSAVWGGATVITPTEDSIENVRVVTNDYDAEDAGRFAGAQTFVTSKSGTNQLHGSLFIAIHRPGLNALQPAVRNSSGTTIGGRQKDTQRFNQWGGSLGGPIIKNRIFAFFAYETSPNSSTSTSTGWYETSSFRSSAPSGSIASTYLGFPGSAPAGTIITTGETCQTIGLQEGVNCNTIAGQGLDIGSPLKTGLGKQDTTATGTATNPGVGGGLDGVADIAYYLTSTPSSSTYQQYNGRLDALVTSKDRLSFAIYWVPITSNFYNGGARAYNLFHHTQINDAFSGIWNHTFGPTWLNEARGNAAGWRWNEITSNPQAPVGLPADSISTVGTISVNQFGTNIGSVFDQWTYSYRDVATKVAGPHTIKFGGEYTSLHYLNDPIGRPSYSFYNIWDFLNDAPKAENTGYNPTNGLPAGVRSDDRENLFGAFAQDNWKIRPTLTLTAGLRYSFFGALYAKQDNIPRVMLGQGTSAFTGLSVATGHNLWESPKDNMGPQLGFNWAPGNFNNKLVIRGGYGLNFNQDEIAITANIANNPPVAYYPGYSWTSPTNPGVNGNDIVYALSSSATSLNGYPANPHAITSFNANGLPTAGNASVVIFGDGYGHVPTSYVQHFSFESDYEFGKEIVATLGYQGSLSKHLINHMTPLAGAVMQGYTLNPLVTGGDWWIDEGMGNNNAMLVEVKHPFVHHFSADAQFQWAKSMDTDGSGPYAEDPYYPLNPAYSYGPSDFNVGRQFKVFGLWQPVIFHGGSGWMEKIVGDWSLSGIFQLHTGFPYSPTYGIPNPLYCTQCGVYNIRPTYLRNGGNSHSNAAFINDTNFANNVASAPVKQMVNGQNLTVQQSTPYFVTPNFASAMQAVSGNGATLSPTVSLPPLPGLLRNAFVGPSYRDFDASLTKGFGLPNTRLLGENARFEIRGDFFNLFNILNLNPGSVGSNVAATNFGQDTTALGGRTITLQGRFSF